MQFLCVTLYAPLSSWGDIAVGEIRGSWDRPSRSAILGLCAAALGLERDAQADHDALSDGCRVAVRLDRPGVSATDYHTAQTIAESDVRKVRPRTRRDLLAAGAPQTILSRRTLLQDALVTIALWTHQDARWTLEALAEALQRPRFALYAGRKANVLGLPLNPRIVEAPTLAAAFGQCPPLPASLSALAPLEPKRTQDWNREVSHDDLAADLTGMVRLRTQTRRDDRPNRTRWHFSERAVTISALPKADAP